MYHFQDTTETQVNRGSLPTSAMNYDGLFFEEAIEGYRTLSVSGREMISLEIEADSRKTGTVIYNQTLPQRRLTVHYQLRHDNAEELLVNYRRLMAYLYRERDVIVYFNDEQDVHYLGRYSASDEIAGDSYTIVSSFDVYCQDPRKYTKEFTSTGFIGGTFSYRTKPDTITITTQKKGSLVISNGSQSISMSQVVFNEGDRVEVDFKEGKIRVNGQNRTYYLDLDSSFEDFYLAQGQTITSSNGELKVIYREVSL